MSTKNMSIIEALNLLQIRSVTNIKEILISFLNVKPKESEGEYRKLLTAKFTLIQEWLLYNQWEKMNNLTPFDCANCFGWGFELIFKTKYKRIQCNSCKGTGYKISGCNICNSTGWLKNKRCNVCNGQGIFVYRKNRLHNAIKCSTCNGKLFETIESGLKVVNMSLCKTCLGSGIKKVEKEEVIFPKNNLLNPISIDEAAELLASHFNNG